MFLNRKKKEIESEKRKYQTFEASVHNISVPCQNLNEDGQIIDVNQEWLDLLGYKKREVVGKHMTNFLAKEYAPVFKTEIQKFFQTGHVKNIPFTFISKKGKKLFLEASGKISFNKEHNTKYTTCVLVDVTKKRESEKALESIESKYKRIILNIKGAAYICANDEHWTMHYISNAISEICGYTPEDLIENKKVSFESLIHPEDKDRVRKIIESKSEMRKPFRLVYKIICKKGDIKWIHERGTVVRDSKGEIKQLEGILFDITKEKELELAINKERETASNYLNIAGVMLIALDTKGKVMMANKKAEEVLCMKKENIIGKDWFKTFIPKDERTSVKKIYLESLKKRNITEEYFENKIVNKKGEHRTIGWHNTIYKQNGKVVGTLSSGEDVTEKNEALRLLKENEEKYQVLFENSADAMILMTTKGNYLGCNSAAHKLFGIKNDAELKKLKPMTFSSNKQMGGILAETKSKKIINQTLKKGYASTEWISRRLDGSTFYSILSLSKLVISGKVRIQETIRDITKQKTAEIELIKQNKDLEIFRKVAIEREHKMIRLEKELEKYKQKKKF